MRGPSGIQERLQQTGHPDPRDRKNSLGRQEDLSGWNHGLHPLNKQLEAGLLGDLSKKPGLREGLEPQESGSCPGVWVGSHTSSAHWSPG